MKINTKYNIDEKVYIPELKIYGIITGVCFYAQLKYDVRFFDGFSPQQCLFLENELTKEENGTTLGFK